jgi:uncharacterized membrane protein
LNNVHYRVHKSLLLDPVIIQYNQVQILISYFINIYCNIFFIPRPTFPKWHCTLGFLDNALHAFIIYPVSTSCHFHPLWFNHLNKPNKLITVAVWYKPRNVSTLSDIAVACFYLISSNTEYKIVLNELNRWRRGDRLRRPKRQNSCWMIYWLHPVHLPNLNRPSYVSPICRST